MATTIKLCNIAISTGNCLFIAQLVVSSGIFGGLIKLKRQNEFGLIYRGLVVRIKIADKVCLPHKDGFENSKE